MAVTINYNVDSIQCYTQYDQYTDVVVKVGWSCIGSGIAQVGPQSGSEVKTYYPNTTPLTVNNNFVGSQLIGAADRIILRAKTDIVVIPHFFLR
jgi:hypothetical protein